VSALSPRWALDGVRVPTGAEIRFAARASLRVAYKVKADFECREAAAMRSDLERVWEGASAARFWDAVGRIAEAGAEMGEAFEQCVHEVRSHELGGFVRALRSGPVADSTRLVMLPRLSRRAPLRVVACGGRIRRRESRPRARVAARRASGLKAGQDPGGDEPPGDRPASQLRRAHDRGLVRPLAASGEALV
jgi:hypothetical protein